MIPGSGRSPEGRKLQEGSATNSTFLAWKIPWTTEPDRLQSMGSEGVGNGGACMHTYHISIHSSVDGCLCCFHVLAIVNSATMNSGGACADTFLVYIFYI